MRAGNLLLLLLPIHCALYASAVSAKACSSGAGATACSRAAGISTLDELRQLVSSSFYLTGYCSDSRSPECKSLSRVLTSAARFLDQDGMVETALLLETSQLCWQPQLCGAPQGARLWFACHDGTVMHMVDLALTATVGGDSTRKDINRSGSCMAREMDVAYLTPQQPWWQRPDEQKGAGPEGQNLTCSKLEPPESDWWEAASAVAKAAKVCGTGMPWYACADLPRSYQMDLLLMTLAAAEQQQGAACLARQLSNLPLATAAAALPLLVPDTIAPRGIAATTSMMVALATSPAAGVEEVRKALKVVDRARRLRHSKVREDDRSLGTLVLAYAQCVNTMIVFLFSLNFVFALKDEQREAALRVENERLRGENRELRRRAAAAERAQGGQAQVAAAAQDSPPAPGTPR